jgi:zinc D-Ala-D-Ala dipeptidase
MTDFARPIPMLDNAATAGDYHDIPIDRQDPRFGEPLVDVRDCGLAGENYYARTDGGNLPYRQPVGGAIRELWCRRTIVTMLRNVNERLAERGLELLVWDAYRPIACQRGLWEFFSARFRGEMAQADDEQISTKVRRYVSDPRRFDEKDPTTWPVHATGGAVDVTLRDAKTGDLVDMGAHLDDMSAVSHTAHFERLFKERAIAGTDIRLRNRRVLYWAMREEGFTNYTYEFWHFDYGDQMYVKSLRQLGRHANAAWYGYVRPPGREVR